MFSSAYALVVGIGSYRTIRPLQKTVQDATDVRDTLVKPSLCGYDPTRVTLLTDAAATRASILHALDALSAPSIGENATVFIFFACHGGRVPSGEFAGNYLLPIDVDTTNLDLTISTSIPGDLFTAKLRNIKSGKLIVVLDCCHAGGIGQPRNEESSALTRGFSSEFHQQLAQGQGRVIIGACSEGESAWELHGDSNGLFTKHLLAGLQGKAPGDDSFVRIFQLYDYVREKVAAEHPGQNTLFKAETRDNFPVALRLGGNRGIATPTINAASVAMQQRPVDLWTDEDVLERMQFLERAELDELVLRIRMPKKLQPARELTLGERAAAVFAWALENESGNGIALLKEKLAKVIPRK